jgi:hypothetical protein
VFLSWSKSDRDKAIVQYVRAKRVCKCGTRPEEWDPEKGGSRDAYKAELGHCQGCAEIQMAQKRHGESTNPLPGNFITLRRG